MEQTIALIEEVVRQDLEDCEKAIRAGEQAPAIASLERAFAKLDTALDSLRAVSLRG